MKDKRIRGKPHLFVFVPVEKTEPVRPCTIIFNREKDVAFIFFFFLYFLLFFLDFFFSSEGKMMLCSFIFVCLLIPFPLLAGTVCERATLCGRWWDEAAGKVSQWWVMCS